MISFESNQELLNRKLTVIISKIKHQVMI